MKDWDKELEKEVEAYKSWKDRFGGFARDMTLRDYFAAKAMQAGIGLIPNMAKPREGVTVPQAVTEMAYEYADAMLKARVK